MRALRSATDSTCEVRTQQSHRALRCASPICTSVCRNRPESVFNCSIAEHETRNHLRTKRLFEKIHTFPCAQCVKTAQVAHLHAFLKMSNSLIINNLIKDVSSGRKFAPVGGDMKPARILTAVALIAMFAVPAAAEQRSSKLDDSLRESVAARMHRHQVRHHSHEARRTRSAAQITHGSGPSSERRVSGTRCDHRGSLLRRPEGAGGISRDCVCLRQRSHSRASARHARRQRRHFRPGRPSTQGRWRRTRSGPRQRRPSCRR